MSLGYMNGALAQLRDAIDDAEKNDFPKADMDAINTYLRDLPYKIDNERGEARAAGRWEMELEFEPRMAKLFNGAIQEQLDLNSFENVATLAESAAIFLRRFNEAQRSRSYGEARVERLEKIAETFGQTDPEAP